MKIKLLVLSLSLALFPGVQAQTSNDGVLWKISGKGIAEPSYLLGTIHLTCDTTIATSQKVAECLNKVDFVITEINLMDYDEVVAVLKLQMRKSKLPLSKKMKTSDYQLLDSVFAALTGKDLADFEFKSPMDIYTTMLTGPSIIGCDDIKAPDAQILSMGKMLEKELYGLETVAYQDSIMKTIPDSAIINQLIDFCKDPEKVKNNFKLMQEHYSNQSALKLYDFTREEIESDSTGFYVQFEQNILTQRNESWLVFMKENLPNVSFFMAVGAAHLGGENGLIQGLKRAGYTVTPVKIDK